MVTKTIQDKSARYLKSNFYERLVEHAFISELLDGGDVLKLFKKTLFLNGSSPSLTTERKSECGCVGGTVRETKRRIERRAQELWFKLDAPLRAF